MSEGIAQEATADSVIEMSPAKERIVCHVCGSDEMRRALRQGFMQQNVYPLFGYFPWRCLKCGVRVILRRRHRRKLEPAE